MKVNRRSTATGGRNNEPTTRNTGINAAQVTTALKVQRARRITNFSWSVGRRVIIHAPIPSSTSGMTASMVIDEENEFDHTLLNGSPSGTKMLAVQMNAATRRKPIPY